MVTTFIPISSLSSVSPKGDSTQQQEQHSFEPVTLLKSLNQGNAEKEEEDRKTGIESRASHVSSLVDSLVAREMKPGTSAIHAAEEGGPDRATHPPGVAVAVVDLSAAEAPGLDGHNSRPPHRDPRTTVFRKSNTTLNGLKTDAGLCRLSASERTRTSFCTTT
jgi:hypothetical protein